VRCVCRSMRAAPQLHSVDQWMHLISGSTKNSLQRAKRNFRRRQRRTFMRAVAIVESGTPQQAVEAAHGSLSLYGSAERTELLVLLLRKCSPDVFWPVFLNLFSSCDASWPHIAELRRSARSSKPASAAEYLSGAALARFKRMPDRIRVYRGCSLARVEGLSWTTHTAVAESFAHGHRGIRVPNAVIATGTISKNEIYGLIVDRDEGEVLLEPTLLGGLKISSYREKRLSNTPAVELRSWHYRGAQISAKPL
jgi:hypothetical protein